ncbi:MAG TPA: class IV adenylate cyclase [Anaerolineales bacterium]
MSGFLGSQELEIKLYLADLPAFQERLEALGAQRVQPRVHELNLRFDTPSGELARSSQVLRLRRDTASRVTYKGPGTIVGGVRARQEIEFTVGDFEAARALFEALGYQVSVIYEKYRATYELDGVLVTLDQLPFGDFAEIEGPDAGRIRAAADKLGLDWEARVTESYIALFDHLRKVYAFSFRHLTFENFAGMEISPTELGVRAADQAV